MDHIQHIYDKYSPGREGSPRYVIAEGYQATYQHVFKAWRESFSLLEPGGLWDWLIPLPGGFYIDKTGFQGIVRAAWCGFGLEELAGVSDITEGNLKNGLLLATGAEYGAFCIRVHLRSGWRFYAPFSKGTPIAVRLQLQKTRYISRYLHSASTKPRIFWIAARSSGIVQLSLQTWSETA